MNIGFIGIGTMGAPMVHCLSENGYPPRIFDLSKKASDAASQRDKLPVCTSVGELAKQSDIVILMLPDSDVVRAVCESENGLADSMSAGSIILDMSSSDPVETRKLGAGLLQRDVTLLDAPVSGGVRKAVSGTLAIMLGGDSTDSMDQVVPVLECMGKVFRAGSLGAGHATKALNNYVSATGLAAACEALIIGREFGLDPATLTEIFNASTGRNNSTENKVARFILSEDFKSAGFELGLMAKDVGLAHRLSEYVQRPLPGVRFTAETFGAAKDALEADADHTEIYRYLANLK